MNSLDWALATASYNGNVYWSRQGTIEVLCRFSGLMAFPYGQLMCPIEVGGWALGGTYQGLQPMSSGCAQINDQELVSQSSYIDYALDRVTCNLTSYTYGDYGDTVWPAIRYRVYMKPNTRFYFNVMTIIPTIVFTVFSFAVFFMSFQVGERLGYGVTLALTAEVSKATMASLIPVAGELLWIELFFAMNLCFTFIALLESIVVLAIAYNTEDYIVPPHLNPFEWDWMRDFCVFAFSSYEDGEKKRDPARIEPHPFEVSRSPSGTPRSRAGAPAGAPAAAPAMYGKPLRPGQKSGKMPANVTSAAASRMRGLVDEPENEKIKVKPPQVDPSGDGDAFMDAAGRLLFFENLFFRLDPDGNGTITTDDIRTILAFTAIDMSAAAFEAALVKADSIKRDGKLDSAEFVDLCIECLWNVPIPQLESAAQNYVANVEALEKRTNTQWRRLANNIDRHCRFWVPFAYVIVMVWVFSVVPHLNDTYGDGEDGIVTPLSGAWGAANPDMVPGWLAPVIIIPILLAVLGVIGEKVYRNWRDKKLSKMLEETASSSEARARTRMDEMEEETTQTTPMWKDPGA